MKKIFSTIKSWFVSKPSNLGVDPEIKQTTLENNNLLSQREIVFINILCLDEWFTSRQLIEKVNENFELTPLQVYRVLNKLSVKNKLVKKKNLENTTIFKVNW
jgi:Fe2+ or Zn2+ uptake regulation protein